MRVAASFNLIHRTILVASTMVCLSTVGAASAAPVTHTHQYDFETASAFVTEPGWTHVEPATAGSLVTFGFLPAAGASRNSVDRLASIQPPTSVTRDEIYSSTNGNPTDDIIFRDIVPANVMLVDLVIYRSDPVDGFAPNFTTSVSFNGGTPILIHSGTATGGTYFPPITASLSVPVSSLPQTMDFFFSANNDTFAGNSIIRLNGIQAIFTEVPVPEPSSLTLLGLGLVGVIRRVRRKAR